MLSKQGFVDQSVSLFALPSALLTCVIVMSEGRAGAEYRSDIGVSHGPGGDGEWGRGEMGVGGGARGGGGGSQF